MFAENIRGTVPKIGFAAMSLPGFLLGEEMTPQKRDEGVHALQLKGYELIVTSCIYSQEDARTAGKMLVHSDVDCICVMLATFVPDYFVTTLLKECSKPVFIWALEREIYCIPTVSTLLIAASLKNLGIDYCVMSANVDDAFLYQRLYEYTKAAMLKNRLSQLRIGCIGHKPSIMYSMESDEFLIERKLGVSLIPIPSEDFYRIADQVKYDDIRRKWEEIKSRIGCINLREEDALESIRFYLSAKHQIMELGLSGYSINCFPNLKARICLAVSLLNDDGIGAGCEGDVHSTILMTALSMLQGGASFNGDFMRIYPDKQAVLFSHCGAGALSLAERPSDICLSCSAETGNGVAVFYQTALFGEVTLTNLVLGTGNMRLTSLTGVTIPDDSGYQGNPMRVQLGGEVRNLLDKVAQAGAGHHWVGIPGDWSQSLQFFAKMTGIEHTIIKPE